MRLHLFMQFGISSSAYLSGLAGIGVVFAASAAWVPHRLIERRSTTWSRRIPDP